MLAHLVSVVYQYLGYAISLEELEDWVLPRLPLLFGTPDSVVADLAATIELGLAEIGDGIRDEQEFRDLLRDASREHETITIFYPAGQWIAVTGSCNQPSPTLVYASSSETTVRAVVGP